MKSVLMSIQPYWVFLIIAKTMGWNIDKEKTVEVRKTYPKDENWDKIAKIYCSKDKKSFAKIPKKYQPLMQRLLGKVIGGFVCDKVEYIENRHFTVLGHENRYTTIGENPDFQWLKKSCLSYDEVVHYGKLAPLKGWHISNLVIYDKPRELREFIRICPEWEKGEVTDKCCRCEHLYRSQIEYFAECDYEGEIPITRPPQSWCYVESEVKGND